MIAGRRVVCEAIAAGTAREILVERELSEKFERNAHREGADQAFRGALEAAEAAGLHIRKVDKETLDEFSSSAIHQGIIALAKPFQYADVESFHGAELIVALDGITDPHNFGAILRSSLIFGARGVLVPKHGASPITPVVTRTSAGATEHLPIAQVTNLQRSLEQLSKDGYVTIGLAAEGSVDIGAIPDPRPKVLVVGAEGNGLRRMVRERCELLASIPQHGPVGSLNASVAAGVALYALARQRNET